MCCSLIKKRHGCRVVCVFSRGAPRICIHDAGGGKNAVGCAGISVILTTRLARRVLRAPWHQLATALASAVALTAVPASISIGLLGAGQRCPRGLLLAVRLGGLLGSPLGVLLRVGVLGFGALEVRLVVLFFGLEWLVARLVFLSGRFVLRLLLLFGFWLLLIFVGGGWLQRFLNKQFGLHDSQEINDRVGILGPGHRDLCPLGAVARRKLLLPGADRHDTCGDLHQVQVSHQSCDSIVVVPDDGGLVELRVVREVVTGCEDVCQHCGRVSKARIKELPCSGQRTRLVDEAFYSALGLAFDQGHEGGE